MKVAYDLFVKECDTDDKGRVFAEGPLAQIYLVFDELSEETKRFVKRLALDLLSKIGVSEYPKKLELGMTCGSFIVMSFHLPIIVVEVGNRSVDEICAMLSNTLKRMLDEIKKRSKYKHILKIQLEGSGFFYVPQNYREIFELCDSFKGDYTYHTIYLDEKYYAMFGEVMMGKYIKHWKVDSCRVYVGKDFVLEYGSLGKYFFVSDKLIVRDYADVVYHLARYERSGIRKPLCYYI